MKVLARNGFIVIEGNGMPRTISSLWEWMKVVGKQEFEFLEAVRHGDLDRAEPDIDLSSGLHKIPSDMYRAYNELWWIWENANRYGIEMDDSFMEIWDNLREDSKRRSESARKRYEEEQTAKAEAEWENLKAKESKCESCDNCPYCAYVTEGELYCEKYRRYLESKVAPSVTPDGRHLMYASHGIPLQKCVEAKAKADEQEKAKFIAEYVHDYVYYAI